MARRDRSDRLLVIVFSAVVGSFLLSTLVVQRTSSDVTTLADSIIEGSMPRIERLAMVRSTAEEVENALSRYIYSTGASRAQEAAHLEQVLTRLAAATRETMVPGPGQSEFPMFKQVTLALAAFEAAVRRTRALVEVDVEDAEAMLGTLVIPAANRLADAVTTGIEFNAQRGQQLAQQIQATRDRTTWLAFGLAVGCVVLGVVGAAVMRRDRRRRRALEMAHAQHQQARADELEQFAGRLAHDIRNPLSTASLAAELIAQQTAEPPTERLAQRIQSSLGRAARITEGLLSFARAGAQPDPGARTDVRDVLEGLVQELAAEAEQARVDLEFGPVPPVRVSCSTGVYLSLISNLVRNALKYLGDAPQRHIAVRVTELGAVVRTEVIDTGPGIDPAILPSLFQPYFRGATGGQSGLGLGLATVKKLAEGHHGCVGARSTPGQGSTFWFELPSAGASEDAGDPADAARTSQPAH